MILYKIVEAFLWRMHREGHGAAWHFLRSCRGFVIMAPASKTRRPLPADRDIARPLPIGRSVRSHFPGPPFELLSEIICKRCKSTAARREMRGGGTTRDFCFGRVRTKTEEHSIMNCKKVTFDDIAQYTNFSKTTISRYFNNPDSLTSKNQEIIAQALIDLNYRQNKVAKILANGRSEFIGVIVPNLYLHYYSEILNQILSSYERFGYKFLVFAGNSNEAIERRCIQELLAYNIEGMIVLSHTISSGELASYGIPIVTIEREDEYTSSVNTDNYMGGVQAASLLGKCHCDILIHINVDVPEAVPAHGRIQGFLDACIEHGLPHELILRDLGDSYTANREALWKIAVYLNEKYEGKRKGIFLANDTYANIFLNRLIRLHGFLPHYRIR